VDPHGANTTALSEFEQSRFGWDHAFVGACLAYQWELPDELVCCIRYHHSGIGILSDARLGRSPVAATALSALLPDQFNQHPFGLNELIAIERDWPAFRLERVAQSVDEQYRELSLGIPNNSPLAPRCADLGGAEGQAQLAVGEPAAGR
jgi:HD-like signal output (HDOD) protein